MRLYELLARVKSPAMRAAIVFGVALYHMATGTFDDPREHEKALMRWADDGGRA